ncbi:V-set and immunoglobulin domain-containing protein 10 [Polymixia lowei]
MEVVTVAAFLQLYLYISVSGEAANQTAFGALGNNTRLPCYSLSNVTPSFTRWMKNGQEIISRNHSAATPSPGRRLIILDDGSLDILGITPWDEGTYLCNSTFQNNTTHTSVQLQVVGGPENVSTSIGPATVLSNGTHVVYLGSAVSFNCSSYSYPSQNLSWRFHGANSSNDSLASGSGSWLDFRMEDIQPSAQGEYICRAQNTLSHREADRSTQLLVYYAPQRHPECLWRPGEDPSKIQFNCTWFGAYPTPTLRWGENHHGAGSNLDGHLYVFGEAHNLTLTLNRSLLFDGQLLKCTAQHPALAPGEEKSCSFNLKSPYPEGEPLVAALEDTSVTLSCTEASSLPPANTTWRRGAQQEDIVPGSKYVVSLVGPVLRLTIVNVSKEDEGLYFCRSENPLGIRELEVYLSVKTSSAYTGAIIGIFLAVLIVGSGVIIAKTVYSSRDRICLGSGFGRMEEERGDVLSLVDSDEEEIFQDTVPRLPPLNNGHHTTRVQIHRIPSSDHEDTEMTDRNAQQQEDTVIEEPVDLVTF